MKKDIDSAAEFDFGFSFENDEVETLPTNIHKKDQQILELQTRLKDLYDTIVPFLDNLCKNPEKTTINWPNRAETITKFKEKLSQIAKESK